MFPSDNLILSSAINSHALIDFYDSNDYSLTYCFAHQFIILYRCPEKNDEQKKRVFNWYFNNLLLFAHQWGSLVDDYKNYKKKPKKK